MSHTHRRKRSHNPHNRGGRRLPAVPHRPAAVRAQPRHRSVDERGALVTDHALVRWLERVVGIDVRERFVREFLPQGRADLVANMQHGRIFVEGTATTLVVSGSKVVTLLIDGVDA